MYISVLSVWLSCVVEAVSVCYFICACEYPVINTLGLVMGGRWGLWERRGEEKYGGVEGYGCFSLGDRACCHGAGPPIGGDLVQSLNSRDCFIIEKFFLSSCLTSHPFPSISLFFFFSLTLFSTAPHLVTVREADKLHKVYDECSSCHPILFWHSYSFSISSSSWSGWVLHKSPYCTSEDKIKPHYFKSSVSDWPDGLKTEFGIFY